MIVENDHKLSLELIENTACESPLRRIRIRKFVFLSDLVSLQLILIYLTVVRSVSQLTTAVL